MLVRELITRFGFDVEQNKLDKLDGSIAKISIGLSAAGAAMMALPALMVQARQGTEQALGGLASVGVKDFEVMEARAKQFSNRWAGFTKAAYLTAAYEVKSALSGLTDESVAEFTTLAGLTGKASKATVDEMVGAFTTGYGIFKPLFKDLTDIEWAQRFTGALGETVAAFKTNGKEMSEAIKNMGAVATAAEIPMEEQLAILGTLQTTMRGSEAGTLYKTFILQAGKAGKALDLAFTDKQGRLKSTFEIITAIQKKFPDLSKAAATAQLQKAFGSDEALRFVLQMSQGMDELAVGIDKITVAALRGTAGTEQMAEALQRGMGSELLRQQIGNLFETLGKPLQPIYDKALKTISGWVLKLDELSEKHPELTKNIMMAVFAIGALLSAMGLLFGVLSTVGGAMMLLTPVAAALGMTVGTLSLSVLAIPLAIAAFVAALYLALDDVYNWVMGNKSAIGELLGTWEDFKFKVGMLSYQAVEAIKSKWGELTGFFTDLWDGIVGTTERAFGKLDRLLSNIPGYESFWSGLGEGINNFIASPGMPTAAAIMPVGASAGGPGGAVTKNYNVNSQATIQVPPGTLEAQQQVIREAAKLAFEEEIGVILRQTSGDYPEHE